MMQELILFQAMIGWLQSNDSKSIGSKVRKMKAEERKTALKNLKAQHRNWKSNPKADKSVLHSIIKEGRL